MSTTTPLFEYFGRTHTALLFAKSLRRAFFPKDLMNISPIVFKDTKSAFGALRVLRNHGLVEHTTCGWKITPKGHAYLRKHAKASQDA
jgi:hypothetical protein